MGAETITAAEFRARCLRLLDEVNRTGITLVITKRGKPVARLTGLQDRKPNPLWGRLKGTMKFHGDPAVISDCWPRAGERLAEAWDELHSGSE